MFPFGFRIVGPTWARRRLVDAAEAFAAQARCDPRAEVARESYLSAFWYGERFRRHLDGTGSTKGYGGPCWAPWLWWDIDRADDLEAALADARRLTVALCERFSVQDADLLTFYSGSKGFHVGLPTAPWRPEPAPEFHKAARHFAEAVAATAGVGIDAGVYDRVRAFRAPNSRHPKTGLHKRRLGFDELMGLSVEGILRLAQQPEPFDVPAPSYTSDAAAAAWREAGARVEAGVRAASERRTAEPPAKLNRGTLDFIRDGAPEGDRHRLLFSASANLAEFDCPSALAHALLTESGLDSGLPPSEVRRQIDCGLAHAAAPAEG